MKRSVIFLLCVLSSILCLAQAKYIFYFIGDGMGSNQVLSAEMYLAELNGQIGRKQLCMTQFPYTGQVATFSHSNGITDSSAAGTCLATGTKTDNGILGLSPSLDTLETIAEKLQKRGYGIGIMTTVAIDHATPAAFYAKVPDRGLYYAIGTQLAHTNFDFFGGAGFHQPVNQSDSTDINLYDLCEQNGYTFAHGYADAQAKLDASKLILIQPTDGIERTRKSECIPYAIDRHTNDLTLHQIVGTAIPYLQRKYDRFFIMAEGGMIDYACHGQDGATAIGETLDMDSALSLAYQFYLSHPHETLIVVTADHETGGMALGNGDYTLNLKALQYQRCSAWVLSDTLSSLFKTTSNTAVPTWEEVKKVLSSQTGLYSHLTLNEEKDKQLQLLYQNIVAHQDEELKTLYKNMNALSSAAIAMLNQEAKLGWTSYSHTAHAVPIFAIGAGAERFSGWHDNTEIAPLILKAVETTGP